MTIKEEAGRREEKREGRERIYLVCEDKHGESYTVRRGYRKEKAAIEAAASLADARGLRRVGPTTWSCSRAVDYIWVCGVEVE